MIPVYNAQDWIEKTLASVLHQSRNEACSEVVIVDDGSTDRSVSIAESVLSQASMDYCLVKTGNGGPSRARNTGWRRAAGQWIQFLDADDLLHPQKIAIQADVARALPPQVAVVYSDWQRLALVNQEWRPVGETVSPVIGDDPVADLLKTENFLATGCQLFRRTWLDKVAGFDERHWVIEDVDLLLRIAMEGGKFHRVLTDFPLFFYRQRSGESLSCQNAREFIEGCLRNAMMVEVYWRSNSELTPSRAYALASIYFQGARYFASSDKLEFEMIVRKIESLVPDFLPPGPRHLRWLSRLIGYRWAERVAVHYRHLKRQLSHR